MGSQVRSQLLNRCEQARTMRTLVMLYERHMHPGGLTKSHHTVGAMAIVVHLAEVRLRGERVEMEDCGVTKGLEVGNL